MSRRQNKLALNKLLSDPDNYGQADQNNALVIRIQDIALEEKGVEGFKKEYGKLVRLFKDDRRISNDTRLFIGSVANIVKSLIEKGRVDAVTSMIDQIVKRAEKKRSDYYTKKAKQKELEKAQIYARDPEAIEKANDKSGTFLATKRTTGDEDYKGPVGKGGQAVVKKDVVKEPKTHIKPVWKIQFKDVPGIDDYTVNGKDLFKDVLAGKSGSVLRKGMSASPEQKLQTAAIQMKLKIKIDGDYGPATKAAVEKFQADNGLTKDGKVGRQTITAMFSDTAKGVAKNIPITGKNADPLIKTTIDNLTKDRSKEYIYKTTTLSAPKNENVYRLNESKIRRLIRSSIRRRLR